MKANTWVSKHFQKGKQVCLVTGGSSGIGLNYARSFAAMGCDLVLVSENRTELEAVAKSIAMDYGVEVETITHDFTDPYGAPLLERRISEYRVGIFVSNAGFGMKGGFPAFSGDRYCDIISCHVSYPTLLLRRILFSQSKEDPLLIINVVTINVLAPTPFTAVYTATKAYLLSLFQSVEAEFSDRPYLWHNMLPGTTDTPFHVKQGVIPQAMVMKPEEVVRRSLDNIGKRIFIPNRMDRAIAPIFRILPSGAAMALAKFFLKRRLGVATGTHGAKEPAE
ncbi:SDR family NAD(P)-dependent oxidoreductase [Leisingera caerulea]|uniref:SDR family NAD(P)-dependent oxidoreductase n=1 Tax=Leisingera caerulea TaxID=506591 RepID=UPI00041149DF|nr:SDR family NAD(P)-dependent oxidoreductase [Leisingera caerulea]